MYIENDSRDLGGPGSDNAYSSGIRFSYVTAVNRTPDWAKEIIEWPALIDPHITQAPKNFGISFGQQLYTPNDIREPALITNDRPYAAWLYLGLTAHFKDVYRSHVFELDLGIIGPEALGEPVQNGYHKIIAKYRAEGWKNQIGTEPTIQLFYQQRQKLFEMYSSEYNKYFDVIPYYGAGLGNVAIDAHVGGMMRAGIHLPDDFGPKKASSTEGDTFIESKQVARSSLYAFIGGRGIGVAKNIFLDGNTFKSSHRVHKNSFVIETEFGFAGEWNDWNAAWRFVTRSPEFQERKDYNSFASISLTHLY
ncbi:MAG: lipid A deacylase LpxR family protein [Bdellovibrionaceae bacterium]|nr:lipid A deacylase LpxR family protein [Bdellovibrio sp.]